MSNKRREGDKKICRIGLTSFMEDLLYYSCCSELQLSHFLAKFMPACKTDIFFESLKTWELKRREWEKNLSNRRWVIKYFVRLLCDTRDFEFDEQNCCKTLAFLDHNSIFTPFMSKNLMTSVKYGNKLWFNWSLCIQFVIQRH